MSYTMEDFQRQYAKEHFAQLTPEEQREALERLSPEQRRQVLQALPPEERLAACRRRSVWRVSPWSKFGSTWSG